MKISTIAGIVLVSLMALSSAQAAETLRFAVIGDRTGDYIDGIYEQILDEIQRLRPEFIITVGDMIQGYTDDSTTLDRRWNEYKAIVSGISVPIYYTPGNHDIGSDIQERLYRRYIGEPYYSFDVKGVHFVILDNGRWEYLSVFPASQLDWLAADLDAHRDADYTIVFMHVPYWYRTLSAGHPDTLHSILVAHGVDAVFTGHFHRYFTGEYDGVRYTGVGSSGAGVSESPGDMPFHFCWVTIDDEGIHIAPIKKDAVLNWDNVTVAQVRMTETTRSKALIMNKLPIDESLRLADSNLTVSIRNYARDVTLADTIVWEVPDGWTVYPERLPVAVDPEQAVSMNFTVSCSGKLYPVPSLTYDFPYCAGKTMSNSGDLALCRTARCLPAETAPTIDGRLDEACWRHPEKRLFNGDGGEMTTEPAAFYFAYDETHLYLAARCSESAMDEVRAMATEHDGWVSRDDCVGYFLQPNLDDDAVYQIYINPVGIVFDQKIVAGEDGYYSGDREWDGRYEISTSREDGAWTMEAAIDLAQFDLRVEPGHRCGLNFRRKQQHLSAVADWQLPIDYNPATFGELIME